MFDSLTKCAEREGLGIKANFADDIYVGSLKDSDIVAALKEKFATEYTPFNLPYLLADQLRGIFGLDYTGPNESDEGYVHQIYEKIKAITERYVGEIDFKDCFIIDDEKGVIRDVDWQSIRKCFFETLSREGYFAKKPEVRNLLDFVRARQLCSKEDFSFSEVDKYIAADFFQREGYCILEEIEVNHPESWEILKSNKKLIFSTIGKLKRLLSQTDESSRSADHTIQVNKIIDQLFKLDLSRVDQKTFGDMFLEKNNQGLNLLLQVVYSKTDISILESLLDFIAKHSELMGRETIQKMLFQKLLGCVNVISLIAIPSKTQPDPTGFLLTFIDECITQLDLDRLKQLFVLAGTKDRIGWNAAIATLALKKYLDEFSLRKERTSCVNAKSDVRI
ncbi:uncharacterized protein RVIR1_08390 [Candidatus Rickettsiella viridis]|uniref:Uncharacterized protein n=1 Tax=Candidatus Rickettsiella viridis TaxID=676208 RepID=A0A2Z5UV06_9COXI|nr:hypothetical protein [Candidatus Rickettsiella viridis]BBB15328.1 uncharacterized protein RVIR1_08390 [Candidatus Rickettsiella viridis]